METTCQKGAPNAYDGLDSRIEKNRRRRRNERRSMAADMRLPTIQKQVSLSISGRGRKDLVVPGDIITSDTGFMR